MADEGSSVNEIRQAPASQAPASQPPAQPTVAEDAALCRRLMRGAAEATLATVADGQPFASLATPAVAPDGSVLLWLSRLSLHTRHLGRDPRCSLLFLGAANGPNPQTRARVTITGQARLVEGEALAGLKAHWLARHPYAALYADFPDFGLWQVVAQGVQFVGGFARARPLPAHALPPDASAVAAVEAAAARIIAHMNDDHLDAVAAIAHGLLGRSGEGWRFHGVDVDGCWLSRGESEATDLARLDFPAPVADATGVRVALVAATQEARKRLENRTT